MGVDIARETNTYNYNHSMNLRVRSQHIDSRATKIRQKSYDLEDILCRDPKATGTRGLPFESTLNGRDDSGFLFFSLRWSRLQSE